MATVFETPRALLDAVGKHLGWSEPLEISQERINLFADATGDHQWIHVDPERAAKGPFGRAIAHGYLTLALASWFLPRIVEVRNISMGVNYGLDRVRFPSPVPAGSRVRAGAELVAAEEIKGCIQATIRLTIQVEGSDRPSCIADTISRYYPKA
jgi:acyl dehydratase